MLSCFHDDDGGFGPAPSHDSHMLYTLSAVQILCMIDGFADFEAVHTNGKQRIANFVAALQQPSGTFAGDRWGETDTRFLFCALCTLSLLGLLPSQSTQEPPLINTASAINHVKACQNPDGGFGVSPGYESHSGQVYTCLGALSITGEQDDFLGEEGKDRLGAWLSERQLPSGGLNGRPEKLADSCYSWWVGCSLTMIGRMHWIDGRKLTEFILQCQDPEEGGIADRPGDMVDVFHTVFGVAGLSLVGYEGVESVDAV